MILTHRPGRESNLHKNPLPATIPTGVIFILFIGGLSYFGARGQAASASGVTPPRFFQAEFKFKHDLGKHIENMVRLKLSNELCDRVNIATTIEDRQGGQDIVIQLDGEDIYFIECKAKWNFHEPAHMSKLQIQKACDEKGHYALCAVDLTTFDGLSNGAFPTIEQLESHIHIHFDVAEKLATIAEHLFAIDEELDENRMTISADYRSNIPKSVFVNNVGFESLIDAIIHRIHCIEAKTERID